MAVSVLHGCGYLLLLNLVKLSEDLQYFKKTSEWRKNHFDFQAYDRDLNIFFVSDNRFYESNTGWLKDYNEALRVVSKPTTCQIQELLSNFYLRKKKWKYVITEKDTFRNATIKEQQNIILIVSSFTVFFNNSFAFFVGHRKRLESSKQILKTAKYIREIKTPEVCLKEIKQDYPIFSLTYLYEYQYTNSSLGKWRINVIIGP